LLLPILLLLLLLLLLRLLSALSLCEEREAARLVFMGWPGQGEVEAATPQFDVELDLPVASPQAAAAAAAAAVTAGFLDDGDAAAADTGEEGGGGLAAVQQQQQPRRRSQQFPAELHLEEGWRRNSRQLGYVTVTRPLRQVRYMLV
jgi:hypothetical protein